MPRRVSPRKRNSTTGRAISWRERAVRLWMGAVGRVAPGIAEEQAVDLFLTPQRGPARRPDLRRAMNVTAPLHDATAEQRELTLHLGGGGRLAMWRWGAAGTGPRILLVHGWAGDAADMAPIAAALVRDGGEALLVDMPAHCMSTGRRTSLVVWMWALRAVASEHGPFDAVVAHSFGGAAVTLAIGELGLDPRGVVLLAPAGSPWDFVHWFAGGIGLPRTSTDGMLRRLSARVGRTPQSLDARAVARTLDVPALVLHDPADAEVPWSHGAAMAEAWPGARLVARPGTGHRRILRDGTTINEIVGFVRAIRVRREYGVA